jgi:ABC-type nitrate/sulfonate/bicarbonate transport system permease component
MADITTPLARAPVRLGGLVSTETQARIVCGLVILLAWELIVRALAPAYVAKPTGVVMAIPKVITDPAFLEATGVTLWACAQGLAISIVLGTVIGLAMGRSELVDRSLRHYINGFNAVPMIIVLPLVSLWFGYTSGARLATIVFAAIFSIIINTADGARSVPREYLEVARSFRSHRMRMLIDIVMPSSLPYFLAGLRLAAGRALIGAVVAFVGVRLLAAFGVGFEVLVGWSTLRFLPWYRRDEKTS